jgi:hypothetical protein
LPPVAVIAGAAAGGILLIISMGAGALRIRSWSAARKEDSKAGLPKANRIGRVLPTATTTARWAATAASADSRTSETDAHEIKIASV